MSTIRGRAGAAISAAVLSLSLLSLALAEPSNAAAASSHRAIYNSAAPRANAPFTAPTNSTWPEGSPHYHGSNGG